MSSSPLLAIFLPWGDLLIQQSSHVDPPVSIGYWMLALWAAAILALLGVILLLMRRIVLFKLSTLTAFALWALTLVVISLGRYAAWGK